MVPNRSSRPVSLLRESYCDGARVKNRTLANLSDWPAQRIETLRAALRGDKLVPAGGGLEIVRALPHGHVAAALGMARRIGPDELLPEGSEWRRKANLDVSLNIGVSILSLHLIISPISFFCSSVIDRSRECRTLRPRLAKPPWRRGC
jgi:hypothetical protein